MEMLSEHTVKGWLEGYILSGRHGLLNSYEPFIHVIDSMFNQHTKWSGTDTKKVVGVRAGLVHDHFSAEPLSDNLMALNLITKF